MTVITAFGVTFCSFKYKMSQKTQTFVAFFLVLPCSPLALHEYEKIGKLYFQQG